MSSRRTHTKSRNGCRECKRRKVKCDESAPCCFNCARHGVVCSLGSRDLGDGIIPSSAYMNGFMPNLDYPTTNISPTVAFSNLANLIDCDRGSATAASTTNPEQESYAFELTHHYCTYTADTIAFRDDMKQVWKSHVPEIGYRCRYVMHGLMALAALHKAVLLPSQSETYIDLAAYYQTLALQRFVTELNRIGEDSWQQAFCFASTVVMYALSSPALRKNDRSLSPLETTTDMLTFSRGLRAITTPVQERLATTKFRPLATGIFVVDEKDPSFKHPRLETSTLPVDIFEALHKLRSFVDRVPQNRRDDYKQAVDEMIRAGYLVAHAGMEPELGMVMIWAFVAPDSVMSDIPAADPFALVMLAYFAVFFAVLESRFWFLKNWPRLMFRAIDENLIDEDGTFTEALSWPRRQIFETYASNSMR